MSHTLISCWEKSLLRLKEGNKKYLNAERQGRARASTGKNLMQQ